MERLTKETIGRNGLTIMIAVFSIPAAAIVLNSWKVAKARDEYAEGLARVRTASCSEAGDSFAHAIALSNSAGLPNAGYYVAQGTQEFVCSGARVDSSDATTYGATAGMRRETIEAAIGSYRMAIRLIPGDALLYHNMAAIYASVDGRKANELYKEAVEIDPANPMYRISLGLAEEKLGDAVAATRDYSVALALAPRSVDSKFFVDMEARRPEMAREVILGAVAFVKMQEESSADPIAAARLGALYLFQDKNYDAQNDLEVALSQLPTLSYAWENIGRIREKEKLYDEAAWDYRRAAYLDPEDRGALIRLAAIDSAEGNVDDAITDYETALRNAPSSDRRSVWYRAYMLNDFMADDILPYGLIEYVSPYVDRNAVCDQLRKASQMIDGAADSDVISSCRGS